MGSQAMPSDVGQVAIHPQEMVIAPKGVILGHVEHLLDNAKEGDLDLGPEPGQHRKDNARSPRAAKASRTDKGPCEHLQVVLAVSSLAADPMEVVRMIRQSSRITTFFKGPFVVVPAAPALAKNMKNMVKSTHLCTSQIKRALLIMMEMPTSRRFPPPSSKFIFLPT